MENRNIKEILKNKSIEDLTSRVIRNIKYKDCKLCPDENACGEMTVKECRDKITNNLHPQKQIL